MKAKTTPTTPAIPATRRGADSAVNRQVLALHVHYWSELFQMNGWKLYKRYKTHLPVERRHEVDKLCDAVAMGNDGSDIQRAVEQILSAIWEADDWNAAIRDPELVAAEPLDADQRADWQRRLAEP